MNVIGEVMVQTCNKLYENRGFEDNEKVGGCIGAGFLRLVLGAHQEHRCRGYIVNMPLTKCRHNIQHLPHITEFTNAVKGSHQNISLTIRLSYLFMFNKFL